MKDVTSPTAGYPGPPARHKLLFYMLLGLCSTALAEVTALLYPEPISP